MTGPWKYLMPLSHQMGQKERTAPGEEAKKIIMHCTNEQWNRRMISIEAANFITASLNKERRLAVYLIKLEI